MEKGNVMLLININSITDSFQMVYSTEKKKANVDILINKS